MPSGMNLQQPSLGEVYNSIKLESVANKVSKYSDRLKSLETQVEHLRALNRALIEHFASDAKLSPYDFLERLSREHPVKAVSETTLCKSCGTLIASGAKACYSCGKLLESDAYILG